MPNSYVQKKQAGPPGQHQGGEGGRAVRNPGRQQPGEAPAMCAIWASAHPHHTSPPQPAAVPGHCRQCHKSGKSGGRSELGVRSGVNQRCANWRCWQCRVPRVRMRASRHWPLVNHPLHCAWKSQPMALFGNQHRMLVKYTPQQATNGG